jgi:hypothetical protein
VCCKFRAGGELRFWFIWLIEEFLERSSTNRRIRIAGRPVEETNSWLPIDRSHAIGVDMIIWRWKGKGIWVLREDFLQRGRKKEMVKTQEGIMRKRYEVVLNSHSFTNQQQR